MISLFDGSRCEAAMGGAEYGAAGTEVLEAS